MPTPTTAAPHRSRPRSLPLPLPFLLAALLALPLLGGIAVSARQSDAAAVSPAAGHASVIAQGLAILPPGDLAWRVTYRSDDDEPADVGKAGPGFLATEQGAILAAIGRDRWTLLLPGEAAFADAGARDVRAAGGAAAWFDIELVPAGRADAAVGGIPVYAGSAFAAPPGDDPRDLGLVRDVLQPQETTTIAAQAAPTLVLATQGALRVASDDGSSADLAVGQAGAFLGGLTIAGAGSAPSSFLAAVVGRPVELPGGGAAATPQAAGGVGGPGQVAVSVYGCPPGTKPRRATPDTCRLEPGAANLTLVALDGDAPRDLGAPEIRQGQPLWDGLPAGAYAIRATGFGPGYDRLFVPGLEAVAGDGSAGLPADDAGGYRLDLTADAPSARLEAYVLGNAGALPSEGAIRIAEPAAATTPTAEKTPRPDKTPDPEKTPKADRARQPAAGTATPVTTDAVARPRRGSITVRVLTCPDPYAAFDAARCAAAAEPYDVSLTGKDGEPLTLADARADGAGGWVWEDLPFDDYVLQQPLLAPGAATYYLPAGELLPDGTGYVLRIDADAPRIEVDLYGLAADSAPPPTPVPAAQAAAEPAPAPPAEPGTTAPPAAQPPAAGIDSDGDGLTDDYEINVSGTDPNVWDTDQDGVSDGEAVLGAAAPAEGAAPPAGDPGAGQEPAPAGDVDSDGDGLTDAQEAEQGTSPEVADSDGDGASDGAEVNAGTSPRDSGDVPQV